MFKIVLIIDLCVTARGSSTEVEGPSHSRYSNSNLNLNQCRSTYYTGFPKNTWLAMHNHILHVKINQKCSVMFMILALFSLSAVFPLKLFISLRDCCIKLKYVINLYKNKCLILEKEFISDVYFQNSGHFKFYKSNFTKKLNQETIVIRIKYIDLFKKV